MPEAYRNLLGFGLEGGDAEDGTHSDAGTFTVASTDLTVSKTAVVIDRDPSVNCATAVHDIAAEQFAIPGACIAYTITVTNNGDTAAATTGATSDTLPAQITFVAFHASSRPFADAGDVLADHVAGLNTATEGTLAAGAFVDLVIRVQISIRPRSTRSLWC